MNTVITIYDAEKAGKPAFDDHGNLWLKNVPFEYQCSSGFIWTDGGPGEDPAQLTVNTKAERYVFSVPRLIFFSNRYQVLSALSQRDASGVMCTTRKFYILVESHATHR